jgi:putative PIN family toxin of toxin-antitoxin system
MANRGDKVTVELDAEMVERARAELGLDSESDTAVVERALNAYLMGRLLDVTQARAGLSEQEAERLAYTELHAARRERGLRDPGRRRRWRLHLRTHRQPCGAPDLVMRAFADDRIEVVASPLLLDELERVLRRPKFAKYVDDRTAREFVERVRRHAFLVDDPVEQPAATRDRKDDDLVALARKESVDALVSGDRDLIDAGLSKPGVWTPRQMVDRLLEG